MEKEILTAKIVGTSFGREDHGIMTFFIHVEGDGWGCGFGGYALDKWDAQKKKRVGTAEGMESLIRIMETLEVDSWEKVKGQYVRVVLEDHAIKKLGHVIKDKWFSFSDVY